MTDESASGGRKQWGRSEGQTNLEHITQPTLWDPHHGAALPLLYPDSSHDVIVQQAATLSYITALVSQPGDKPDECPSAGKDSIWTMLVLQEILLFEYSQRSILTIQRISLRNLLTNHLICMNKSRGGKKRSHFKTENQLSLYLLLHLKLKSSPKNSSSFSISI